MAKINVDRHDNLQSMEKEKFRKDDVTGEKFVAVCDEIAHQKLDEIANGSRLSYQITYNATTDVIEYYEGGLAGTLVATLTLTYQTARKKVLLSGEWS